MTSRTVAARLVLIGTLTTLTCPTSVSAQTVYTVPAQPIARPPIVGMSRADILGRTLGQTHDFYEKQNEVARWQQEQRQLWLSQQRYAERVRQQQESQRLLQEQQRYNQNLNSANSTPRYAPAVPLQSQRQQEQQLQQWNQNKNQLLHQWQMQPLPPVQSMQRMCSTPNGWVRC